jgi:hypothetical protein
VPAKLKREVRLRSMGDSLAVLPCSSGGRAMGDGGGRGKDARVRECAVWDLGGCKKQRGVSTGPEGGEVVQGLTGVRNSFRGRAIG